MSDSNPHPSPRAPLRRLFQTIFRLWPFSARAGLESALAGDEEDTRQSFDETERVMLQNVLRLRARTLADVMVARENIVAVPASATLEELITLFGRAHHSRLPVYRGTLDEPAGIIHIRDALAQWRNHPNQENIASLMREPLFAPPQMRVADLLRRMQGARMHVALVVDEHGGICGLVSIEDLVEEIVGEIEDEHDPHQVPLAPDAGGQIELGGQALLEDIEKALDCVLPQRGEAVRTLGGWLAAKLGRMPKAGEKFPIVEAGLEVEILKADARRIHRAAIRRKNGKKKPKRGDKSRGDKSLTAS